MKSEWYEDGPELPVEFCRQSNNGRITLVITAGAQAVRTLWCELDVATLDDAVTALRIREGTAIRFVDRLSAAANPISDTAKTIQEWTRPKAIDGVVWTALPPKFNNQDMTPTCEQVVNYLRGTVGEVRTDSETYVRRTPAQIKTAYRAEIELQLGWTPL